VTRIQQNPKSRAELLVDTIPIMDRLQYDNGASEGVYNDLDLPSKDQVLDSMKSNQSKDNGMTKSNKMIQQIKSNFGPYHDNTWYKKNRYIHTFQNDYYKATNLYGDDKWKWFVQSN